MGTVSGCSAAGNFKNDRSKRREQLVGVVGRSVVPGAQKRGGLDVNSPADSENCRSAAVRTALQQRAVEATSEFPVMGAGGDAEDAKPQFKRLKGRDVMALPGVEKNANRTSLARTFVCCAESRRELYSILLQLDGKSNRSLKGEGKL